MLNTLKFILMACLSYNIHGFMVQYLQLCKSVESVSLLDRPIKLQYMINANEQTEH